MSNDLVRAADPATQPEVLMQLARRGSVELACTVVRNPSMPFWALQSLAESRIEPEVLTAIYANTVYLEQQKKLVALRASPPPPPVVSADLQNDLPVPGVYPVSGAGSTMRYWNGTCWDPRPIAHVPIRVLCWIFDSFLGFVFAALLSAIFRIPLNLAISETTVASNVIGALVFAFFFMFYFVLGYRIWGRTPGMRVGSLFVVSIETGSKPSWKQSWLRGFVLMLGQLSGILSVVWLVSTVGSKSKQGPHDHAGKTLVLQQVD